MMHSKNANLKLALTKAKRAQIEISDGLKNAALDSLDGVINALSEALEKFVHEPKTETWKWMTNPTRNNGNPIPVQIFTEDGVVFYRPFNCDATDFEWSERAEDWREVTPPDARPAPVPPASWNEPTPDFYISELSRNTIRLHNAVHGRQEFSKKQMNDCVVPVWFTTPPTAPAQKILWNEAQHERAYRNSPELQRDVKSLAAFKRLAKEIAAMYGIS